MDDSDFWNLIETAHQSSSGDLNQTKNVLFHQLMACQPAEIEQFQQILQSKLDVLYTYELWGAAYMMNGGCSDDGFEYFRCWLISLGKSAYDLATNNPDLLADAVTADDDAEGCEFEPLRYVASRAYEKITGLKMPHPKRVSPRKPGGIAWDFDDKEETARRLPRVTAAFK